MFAPEKGQLTCPSVIESLPLLPCLNYSVHRRWPFRSSTSFHSIPKKEEPMSVHRQKKCTTPNVTDSTEGQSVPTLPEPQEFQQHIRELARGAIRIVLEAVMREELDALIGVAWGESSPKRKGYRNGYYQRDLV